jgi:O-antigen ligase
MRSWQTYGWLALLCISLYTLYKTQGRTEIAGFIAGAWVVLWSQRRGRAILIPAAVVGAVLLFLVGFYSAFWMYFTLGHGFDASLSGRTVTWRQGWDLIQQSPWIGLGFQADRIFLQGQHMSNGLLHALAQAGFIGTIPWVAALLFAWVLVFRLLHGRGPTDSLPLPADVPGILAFLTVSTVAESTFAFFSAAWIIGAPLLGYVQCVAWQRRVMYSRAKSARQMRARFASPEAAIHR